MSILRQNLVTRQWVIFAPARNERPQDYKKLKTNRKNTPPHDPECPFCPGNEHLLPRIILELGKEKSNRWMTRVVPNLFPAVNPSKSRQKKIVNEDVYASAQAHGYQEVIIENPAHNSDIATMSTEEVITIIDAYQRRMVDLLKKDRELTVYIFRNHGACAGTSLIHPHSQLIATTAESLKRDQTEREAERYFEEKRRCVFCEVLDSEIRQQKRIVYENNSFLAFIPYAAEVPFEIWIVPKRHHNSFSSIRNEEKLHLIEALKDTLLRLYRKLEDPDYNYIIHSFSNHREEKPYLHWYLQILPKLITYAGFELGSGIFINPSLPENDCSFLKEE